MMAGIEQEDLENEINDLMAENERLRAVMKQAAEWLERIDSFPLPLDARRKLNETEGLLLNGGDDGSISERIE